MFVTDTNGTVATTMQKGPNGAGGWAAWANIKGSCAGWPVPFVNPAKTLEVFCRTTAGTVAMSNGRLGHAHQKAAGGAIGWSAITAMGGTILGSPHAWVGVSGAPEIAGLNANHAIADNHWTGRAWTGWVQLGGSF